MQTGWVAISGNGRYAVAIGPGIYKPSGPERGHWSNGAVVDTVTGRIVALVPGQPQAISWNGDVVIGFKEATNQAIAFDWQPARPSGSAAQPPNVLACRQTSGWRRNQEPTP